MVFLIFLLRSDWLGKEKFYVVQDIMDVYVKCQEVMDKCDAVQENTDVLVD